LVYASARDVTQTKELEAELRDLAQTDPLTGLFNRRAFEVEAQRQIDFLRRFGPGGALFLFDIDDFKTINDSFGHQAGDEALKKVASTIETRTRTTDICGRLGGDEFVILFPGVGHNEAEMLANGLLGFIRDQTVGGDDSSVSITSSIGIALFLQADVGDIGALLANADSGMYAAKRAGGNGFAFTAAPAQL
jgi:diguanylate cyclase (GGDEF)-like protein